MKSENKPLIDASRVSTVGPIGAYAPLTFNLIENKIKSNSF